MHRDTFGLGRFVKASIHYCTLVGFFALVFVFACCDVVYSIPGSDEAEILSFTMDGMVGTATIDSDKKTVALTVEPMDISSMEPEVTVSAGATLTTTNLVDGQAVFFKVIAENGAMVPWRIFIDVQYGISFTYAKNSQRVVLTNGVINSLDADDNLRVGDGLPSGSYASEIYGTVAFAAEEDFDIGLMSIPESYSVIQFEGSGTNEHNSVLWIYTVEKGFLSYSISQDILRYDEAGGVVVGTFSGTATNPNNTKYAITDGFFKVLRLDDNVQFTPDYRERNVYFCGGQSNANILWYETIKSELLRVDPTAIVLHAVHPSAAIRSWYYESSPKKYYFEDLEKIRNAIELVNYNIAGFFWFQGERDSKEGTPELYGQRFLSLFEQYEKDLSDTDFSIFLIIIYHPDPEEEHIEGLNIVRQIQKDLIDNVENIYGLDSIGYERGVNKHSQPWAHLIESEYIRLGKDLAKIAINVVY